MPEALPTGAGIVIVLAGAALLAAAEALLDVRRTGGPWRVALLAPAADAARLLRRGRLLPTVWGAIGGCALVVALVLALGAVAVLALMVALLVPPVLAAVRVGGRAAGARAAAVQAPAVLALGAPLVAAGGFGTAEAVESQAVLWGAVAMPAASVLVLAGALAAVDRGPFRRVGGPVPGGRMLLVATGVAVTVVLLGAGAGPEPVPPALWLALKAGAVLALLVAVDRALPALPPEAAVRIAVRFGLPLAALQLALTAWVALAAP